MLLPLPSHQPFVARSLAPAAVAACLSIALRSLFISLARKRMQQSEIRKYRDVYRLYEFPRRPASSPPQINGSMTPRRKAADSSVAVDPKAAMGWAKHVSRETAANPPKYR